MVIVYVYLPEEAVDCWAPMNAVHIVNDVYRIIDEPVDDPVFEFAKGDLVRCRTEKHLQGIQPVETLTALNV